MKNKIKPLAKFRIYIWKSSLYYDVFVWKYKKEMLTQGEHIGLRGNNYGAFCSSFRIKKMISGIFRKTRQLGELHFHNKQLGMEVLTHESTHAILNALHEMEFDFSKLREDNKSELVTDREETLCFLVGRFARMIADKLYELGFCK